MRWRILGALAAAAVSTGVWGCGGGTNLTTSPTGCAATVSPATQHAPAAGGDFAVSVTVAQGCDWTATATESWVTLMRGSGVGSGSAAYTIAPNTIGDARSARIRVGEQSIAVTQSPADCTYTVHPAAANARAGGETIELRLDTKAGCLWSASTTDAWIVLPIASGSGPGPITATIAANTTGSPRSGSIDVGGHTIAVTQEASSQAAPCGVTLSGRTFTVPAAGGALEIGVVIGPGCSWRTHGLPGWIETSLESATASARPVFTVAANTSRSARAATFQIADQAVTITQAGVGCAYSVGPASQNVPNAGGAVQFTVTAGAGCAWTAGSTDGWLNVAPANGSGNGTVTVTAAANPTARRRSGSVQVADQAVRVEQDAAACAYSLGSSSANAGVDGESLQFNVVATSGCGWKADTGDGWIRIDSGSGTGNGSVRLTVAANPGTDERRGSIRVEGQTFTVTQSRCTYQVSWRSAATGEGSSIDKPMRAAPAGDTLQVSVDTGVACTWQNSRPPEWIAGAGAADHRGDGGFKMSVSCNASRLARRGSMVIAGRDATIEQAFDPSVSCRP